MPKAAKTSTFKSAHRSKLETKVAEQLEKAGVDYEYEGQVVQFEIPARKARYTPDFVFPNSPIILEAKGWRFGAPVRQRMVLAKKCNPDLDIRFVFEKASLPIYKGSKTSLSDWCEKNGFPWADKGEVPKEWIKEINDG